MTRSNDRPGNDRVPPKDEPRADAGNDPVTHGPARTPTRDAPDTAGSRRDDHPARESFIGTDHRDRVHNASWGAIFAGAVTFFAVMLVFALISAALGLSDASATAVGIWSVVAILLALAAAGYIAGALAVRGGFIHGLVTWATSLVGIVLLVGWLGSGVLSAVGGAVGTIAETAAQATETSEVAEQAEVDQQDMDQAQQEAEATAQDAQDTLAENQDEIAEGTWWAVGGLLVGALVAGFAGAAGARSAQASHAEHNGTRRQRVS
ncbi:MAG: hypothetical protein ACK4UY_01815 [Dietzia sp.]